MQTQQIDLNALADYALNTLDCHPDFEDDAFAFTFEDVRIYCERKSNHFALHIGNEVHTLPRH